MTHPFSQDLSRINKFDTQRKGFLFLFLLLVFLASIVLTSNLRKGKDTSKTGPGVTTQVKQSTSLTLSPISDTMKVGQSKKVSVELLDLPVTAVDIVLTYDPAVFSVSGLENGTVFDRVLVRKVEPGTITYSAAVSPERANDIDRGMVFSFSAKALKESSSSAIEFNTQKTITALNGQNTLGLSTGGKYKVSK